MLPGNPRKQGKMGNIEIEKTTNRRIDVRRIFFCLLL